MKRKYVEAGCYVGALLSRDAGRIERAPNPSSRFFGVFLTERQQQILDFIQRKQETDRLTPTLREIASHFRFSRMASVLAPPSGV